MDDEPDYESLAEKILSKMDSKSIRYYAFTSLVAEMRDDPEVYESYRSEHESQ